MINSQIFHKIFANYRFYIVYIILIGLVLILFWRIVTLHLSQTDSQKTLREKGINQSIRTVPILGYRGNIFDRNGDVLALSVPLKSVIIDPERFIEFLRADFLVPTEKKYLTDLAKIIKKYPGISTKLYKKISNSFNLKQTLLTQKLATLGTKVKFSRTHSHPALVKSIDMLIRRYLNACIDTIFTTKINAPIYTGIAQALNISIPQFILALKSSSSRKYLKIATDLSIEHSVYKNIKNILSKKQRVFYKNGRYSEQYLYGAILIESQVKRYYPQAEVSAALLGFTNSDDKGIEGLEKYYDPLLAGKNGKKQMAFSGDSLPYADIGIVTEAKQGQDLHLTIDNNIQYYTYAAIESIVKQKQAKYGSAIVVNPNGEILAMVNYPSTDPNDRSQYQPKLYRNRVLLDALEVGSIMKPFTALFGLEKGRIKSDEVLDLTKAIAHHKPDKYATLTISQVIQKSHNLGILSISERLSKQEIWTMLSHLGFGQNSGALPSIENSGILKHYKKWYLSDKRSISFGYGPMNTTLAQLAKAYLVFLNQGRITDLKLKKTQQKAKFKPVFNQQAITALVSMLDKTVSNKGSGHRAQIKDYDVAGKTGTTRLRKKNAKGYDENRHSAFFAGFAPTYQPQYLVIVHIYEPKGRYAGGASVGAPAFKLIMKNILKTSIKYFV